MEEKKNKEMQTVSLERDKNDEDKPLSIRIQNSKIKEKFKAQAKEEGISQGALFEKIMNVYMGDPMSDKAIPFKVVLFKIDNINQQSIPKIQYKGYGIPTYLSESYPLYKRKYYDDIVVEKQGFWTRANRNYISDVIGIPYNDIFAYQCTELLFTSSQILYRDWYDFKYVSKNGIEQFKEDFKVSNPQNYRYMSAFRVFKESKYKEPDRFMVNEHMYLINEEKYNNARYLADSEWCQSWIKNLHKTAEELKEQYEIDLEREYIEKTLIYADKLDLSVSMLYEVTDISKAEKQLSLDREYLSSLDVDNLKNIFYPTTSKHDPNLSEKLSSFLIRKGAD